MLLNLAESRARELLYRHETAWYFEGRKGNPASTLQRSAGNGAPQHKVRHRNLPTQLVLHTDDGSFRHLILFQKKILNLARIDVEPARDNEIALSAQQSVITVGRTLRDVSRLEPAILKGSLRGLLAPPVTGKDIRPAQLYLTLNDARRDAGQRQTYRTCAALPEVGIRDIHQRLRHSVALKNGVAEFSAELLKYLLRERRGAGDKEPHGGAHFMRSLLRKIQQAHIHRRHSEEERRFEVEELV